MASSIGSGGNEAISYTPLHAASRFSPSEIHTLNQGGSNRNRANDAGIVLKNYAKASTLKTYGQPNSHSENTQQTRNSSEVNDLYSKDKPTDEFEISYGSGSNDEDEFYYEKAPLITNSFISLAAELGANNGKITKEQLDAYLQSIKENASPENAADIVFIKNLIAKFDAISGGKDYISSFAGMNDAQDYTTITPEQVTLPIDIRI